MATHRSKTLFKPTASAGGSLSRSKACKRHDRASPEMLQTAANCCQLLPTVANCKWRPSQNLLCLWLWPCASMPPCPPFVSVALTMMKFRMVFYSDSIPDFETQLWLMLALTLFRATALAWAAATSTLPGVFSTSPCKKKAKLEDCLHSESQCFTCTMLRLTAF